MDADERRREPEPQGDVRPDRESDPLIARVKSHDNMGSGNGSGGSGGGGGGGDHLLVTKISAAGAYALSSVAIQVANKLVLTTYSFPSAIMVALSQCVFAVVALSVSKTLGLIDYPDPSLETLRAVMPLPLIQVFNVGFGLFGTKAVSIPMFTALRRSSILMTLLAEIYILHDPASFRVKLSVFLLCVGSLVAALNDLSFNMAGYVAITLSAVATTGYGVVSKIKLTGPNKRSKWELLWYNSAVSIPFFAATIYGRHQVTGIVNFADWHDALFLLFFALSTCLGFLLNFFILFNTQVNGPLATTIVGSAKNVLTTYLGMLGIGGDYVFTWLNFFGINLSMAGALLYSAAKFTDKQNKKKEKFGAPEPKRGPAMA